MDRPSDGREHELVQRAQLLRRPRRTSTRRRSTTCEQFFKTYYAPNNAVLVVTGDFDVAATKAWIAEVLRRRFRRPRCRRSPISPSRGRRRRSAPARVDSLATRPAIGIGYHVPERFTPEWYAFGLLDQILGAGARLAGSTRSWSAKRGLTGGVDAGINFGLGNMYDYRVRCSGASSPSTTPTSPPDSLIAAIDAVVEPLRTTPVDQATLDRALVKMRSDSTRRWSSSRASAARICSRRSRCSTTTRRASIGSRRDSRRSRRRYRSATAQEYLRRGNRTVYLIKPGAKSSGLARRNRSATMNAHASVARVLPSCASRRGACTSGRAKASHRRRRARRRTSRVPARRAFTLANGMQVSLVPFGTIPKVFVRLAVRGGHRREAERGRAGRFDVRHDARGNDARVARRNWRATSRRWVGP